MTTPRRFPPLSQIRRMARNRTCRELVAAIGKTEAVVRAHIMDRDPAIWARCKANGTARRNAALKAQRHAQLAAAGIALPPSDIVRFRIRQPGISGRLYDCVTGCHADDFAAQARIEARGGERVA